MNEKITRVKNGRIITGDEITEGKSLYFSENKILAVTSENLPCDTEIDACGNYVSPGFIDTHVHGGGGSDFMDGGTEPILNAAQFHLKHGTTTILPTTLACSFDTLKIFLDDVNKVIKENMSDANTPGVHLEGPYFSHAQSGAQNPEYITPPNPDEYKEIIGSYGDIIKKWSFAPELPGGEEFCEYIAENGVIPSAGHSDGTYDDMKRVHEKGCRHVTHLYSGMSTITRHMGYRKLGIIESAYCFDDVYAELIADGKHLPPELMQMIIKLKGAPHVCLVTDAMRGAGQESGESYLGRKGEEMPCVIEDGVAKLTDRSAFAGSVATADRLVRTIVRETETSLTDAVKMITEVPAEICGLDTKGRLKENYDADIIIFDENINIKNVISKGKIIKE